MMGKATWKEMYIDDGRTFHALESVWFNSSSAFGPGKKMVFEHGSQFVVTNLSERDLRALARMDRIRLPERVTAAPEVVAEILSGELS